MRILITGANGFIGRYLASRLHETGGLGAGFPPYSRLTLLDLDFAAPPVGEAVQLVRGSIADRGIVAEAVDGGVDVVFHLATVPGGWTEQNFELALDVNVHGTEWLLAALRRQPTPAKLVFASSAGVFGTPLPPSLDDNTLPEPTMSYGAHKLIGEILVAAYTRKGWVDGRSVRLSGIVVRPPTASGLISAFLSDVMHAARAGRPFALPMSEGATTWLMSVPRAVDNLVHAARIPADGLPDRRAWMLPALRLSMREIVDNLSEIYGAETAGRITFAPDATIEAQFGRYGPLTTAIADRLGFSHDGTARALIERAMALA